MTRILNYPTRAIHPTTATRRHRHARSREHRARPLVLDPVDEIFALKDQLTRLGRELGEQVARETVHEVQKGLTRLLRQVAP